MLPLPPLLRAINIVVVCFYIALVGFGSDDGGQDNCFLISLVGIGTLRFVIAASLTVRGIDFVEGGTRPLRVSDCIDSKLPAAVDNNVACLRVASCSRT